jgi:hypothetical protein
MRVVLVQSVRKESFIDEGIYYYSSNLNMSYLQHKDRSIEAKRSLREQVEYLQEPQEKKRGSRVDSASKNDDMERILTYSIQRAKEKMHHIDSSIQQKTNQ